MSTKKTEISAEARAISDVLRANPGKAFTFAELAAAAGVDAKTGYLTAVKRELGLDNITIGETEREVVVTKTVRTYTFNA